MIGKTLDHYEILEPLGAGGMGEVYLGRDSRLDRKVAIKVLPPEFASDPERLARFEQEAKAAAALNHPHIAAVFDIGFVDGDQVAEAATDPHMDVHAIPAAGVHYIVQEYLQGETLGARLATGALPIKKTLALAIEIGEALGAAHEAGIIHRDLKPANVFITKDGHAKVLDFGLAKLTEMAPAGDGSASMSPTLLGTVAGQVMGTAGYMAPEQASGNIDIDHRADLFAFGSLLYEMATGTRAFSGRSIAETLSLIQHEQPSSIREINRSLPAELERIVRKALAKDPDDRYQHTDDLVVDLRGLGRGVEAGTATPGGAATPADAEGAAATTTAATAAAPRGGGPSWALVVPMLAVVALVAGIAGRLLPGAETTPPAGEMRFSIDLPAEATGLSRGTGLGLAISADGRTIVFNGHDELGTRRLYRRRIDDTKSVPIPNAENGRGPRLSPEGDWLVFQPSLGEAQRVLVEGSEPLEVCSSCNDVNWADDGNVYFSYSGSLYRMPVEGGDRELVAAPRPEEGVWRFSRLNVLPGSKVIAFEIGNYDFGGIGVLRIADGAILHISPDGSEPFYSTTGHILFTRGGTVFAVPFDPERFEVMGSMEDVLQGVRVENAGAVQAALAGNGTLVYQPVDGPQRTQLVWVDRDGTMEVAVGERKNYASPRISPGGSTAAVVVNENGKRDIWIVDLATGSQRQLTTVGSVSSPAWGPDGTAIAYGVGSEGAYAIYLANAGSGVAEELVTSEYPLVAMDFTPDGSQLVFFETSATQDPLLLDIEGKTHRPLFVTAATEAAAALSPDGEWLAYGSNKTGTREIYVRRFPDGDEIPVTANNGQYPMWSKDGSELVYQAEMNQLLAAPFNTETETFGSQPLFVGSRFWLGVEAAAFDVAADGRLLMIRHRDPTDAPDRLEVILNFSERLKRLAPAGR